MVPNVEEGRNNVFVIKMNMQVMNEDMTILKKMHNVLSKETKERLPPLRGIEKHRLLEATGLERRYKLKRRWLPVTREEVKERIKAKNNKTKRYQSRIN